MFLHTSPIPIVNQICEEDMGRASLAAHRECKCTCPRFCFYGQSLSDPLVGVKVVDQASRSIHVRFTRATPTSRCGFL